jgi:hypothetical protein
MPEMDRGLPVVFIHGTGGGARLWAPQMTSFSAAGYRPVAPDLPGYGERPAVDHMDFEGLAADIEALKLAIVRNPKSDEYRKALKGTGERLTIAKQILAREEARASHSP